MTAYEDMSATEIRAELDDARRRALEFAREYRTASQSPDWAWQAGIGVALDQALAQCRRLEQLLQLGIAA